ncbi:hypothetical protein WUBG_02254 [Wuchereria bancrofti]|uniref:Uncharacterized protein n=1 Tax=Wuchereria bancrofti TaxID=6293 RepID=J9EW57_WUCBA|nr:hypothetical protein WUBG_02254 [Wuchereria bancrofti]
MKKIWKSVLRTIKNRNYQQKAIKYAEDMEKTEAVHRAPRHPTEQKYFQKVQADEKITQEIKRKNNILIGNMNKITVTSSEPESRWTTTKELQSKDTEWVHRNDQIWEFGFYEPPPEKIPKGKLMFREAIEILRTQCDRDFVLKLNEERRNILLPQILESLEKHPAMQRIGNETFNTVWQYFRPFERKEQQYVVKRKDIDELRDAMLGFYKDRKDEGEKERLERLEKMKELKAKEDVRLSQELKKLGLVNEDKEPDKAVKDDTEIRRLEQAK